MSDPVLEAAQALAPFLAGGADSIAAEAKRQLGESAVRAARRVAKAVREALGTKHPSEEAVASALRTQLGNGTITEGDLRDTVKVLGAGRDNRGIQVGGNAYFGSRIDVKGDFKG